MFKKLLAFCFTTFSLFSFATSTTPKPVTAIVGAMDVEIQALLPTIKKLQTSKIGNNTFYTGEIAGQSVVVTKSGVGKVNAAMTTTLLIQSFGVNKLIFTGIAGASSPELEPTDVVISSSLVQHDVDLTVFGSPKGLLDGYKDRYFAVDKTLQKFAFDAAVATLGKEKVHQGIIASGDQFIANKEVVAGIYKEFDAMAVEMEGAALAQVANAYDIPYVVIRTISDKADGSAHMVYEQLKTATADNSAKITIAMLKNFK